jgi:hypothetical protein
LSIAGKVKEPIHRVQSTVQDMQQGACWRLPIFSSPAIIASFGRLVKRPDNPNAVSVDPVSEIQAEHRPRLGRWTVVQRDRLRICRLCRCRSGLLHCPLTVIASEAKQSPSAESRLLQSLCSFAMTTLQQLCDAGADALTFSTVGSRMDRQVNLWCCFGVSTVGDIARERPRNMSARATQALRF